MGILKPFTVHSAFLYVIDVGDGLVDNIGGSNLAKIEDVTFKGSVEMQNSRGLFDSQIGISPSRNCSKLDDGKRRKNKKISYKDLTWSSFYKAAFECSDLELAEVYFATDLSKPKKLKFLKCWMKQAKLSSHYGLSVPGGSKSHHHIKKEIDERFNWERSRNIYVLTSLGCKKILVERLVNSSIHCLHQKHESRNSIESQTPMIEPEDSRGTTVAELIHLLLEEPKNLKEKRKDNDSAFQATNSSSTLGNIVREYELQILLRMEILQPQMAGSIKELMKQKLVKQICSLLEIIQYLVEGGLHGHVILYDYVERTIKTSEDSNHSWREKQERHGIACGNKNDI